MKVPAAIAEILKREGVDILFGYPRNAVLEAAAEPDRAERPACQTRASLAEKPSSRAC